MTEDREEEGRITPRLGCRCRLTDPQLCAIDLNKGQILHLDTCPCGCHQPTREPVPMRVKVWRSIVIFVWVALFMAIPLLIEPKPVTHTVSVVQDFELVKCLDRLNRAAYTGMTWLSLMLAMGVGGLLVFLAMMPETRKR